MRRRLLQVGWSAALNMVPTLTNLVAAWLVLHFADDDGVWGGFVAVQLLVGFGLHVLAWGNRDYLLRVFARESGSALAIWRQVLVSRGALLFIALPVALLLFPAGIAAMLLLWLLMGFLRQSFDVVVTFRRDFAFGALTEVVATVFLLGTCWVFQERLSVDLLVTVWAVGQGIRLLPFLVKYGREYLVGEYPLVQFRYYQLALPFFLLGFAGMLLGRVDLYCLLADKEAAGGVTDADVGHYQIWTGLLMYLQGFAAFLVQPMMKYLYRLPYRSIWKLSWRMLGWGTGVLVVGMPAVWLMVNHWYEVEIPWEMYPMALVYVLPVYFVVPLTFYLYRLHAQQTVLLANGAGILANLGTSILLIPRLGIVGAMTASVVGQVLLMGLVVGLVLRNAPRF